jgi:hypothetical protein
MQIQQNFGRPGPEVLSGQPALSPHELLLPTQEEASDLRGAGRGPRQGTDYTQGKPGQEVLVN